MESAKRVLLFLQATRGIERGLLTGIARYSSLVGPWTFYRQPHTYVAREEELPFQEWAPEGAFCSEDDLTRLGHLGVPTILYNIDAYSGFCPAIITDNKTAGELAARHLLDQGHRHFAFCGYSKILWSDARRDAFLTSMAQVGHSVQTYHIRRRFNWVREEPRLRAWLAKLTKPIGIFCANDDLAESVLETCRVLNYSVPEDVSLLGVDDDEYICQLQNPPLSSVRIASDVAGYEAAALLDRLMTGLEEANGQRILASAVGITPRQSTSILLTQDPEVRKALLYIREHADRPLLVSQVVAATSISHRALNSRFHAECGCSILKQVTRARIDHISRLLTETTMRICEIAEMVGYNDERHIGRYFKRSTGMTPKAYREKYARLL